MRAGKQYANVATLLAGGWVSCCEQEQLLDAAAAIFFKEGTGLVTADGAIPQLTPGQISMLLDALVPALCELQVS